MSQLVYLLTFLTAGVSTAASATQEVDALVEWISSMEAGFFNRKQKMMQGSTGFLASKTIRNNELLLQVPWEAIINDLHPRETSAEQEDENDQDTMNCGLVRQVALQMKLGNLSGYAPYVEYLKAWPRGRIPSAFSHQGQDLLFDILESWNENDDQFMPPQNPISWLEVDWYEECGGSQDDELSAHAAMMVVSKAFNDKMVPLMDIYNHKNGDFYNTRVQVEEGAHFGLYASRDIEKGEEVHVSYNLCNECETRHESYGTAEIFRDYGIVEAYPQRWFFAEGDVAFQLDEIEDDGTEDSDDEDDGIRVTWISAIPRQSGYYHEFSKSLKGQVDRLYKIRNVAYNLQYGDQDNKIPEYEWNLIFEYHQAISDALAHAYNSLQHDDDDWLTVSADQQICTMDDPSSSSCGTQNHYDELKEEEDDLDYVSPTCENWEWMNFGDHDILETVKTSYQNAKFNKHPETGDVCFDLDTILQICSSYRPQYHEFVAHFPARFIEEVKRVIFVGGGDSMLLHEALKYPTIEKVVGLELDQTVTRKSFKYFNTRSHFDDDRVEWWFGDATKSLLLLPKEYWGSFDLVLVDLSETVMALSVTDDLDVFDALALLLKPEGVMVKNEIYLEAMSKVFDYTIQIHYDSPKICSQMLAMGSNRVDFFHQKAKDHKIHTHLLLPLEKIYDRFEYMHDYRKNDAVREGKCNDMSDVSKNSAAASIQRKSAGILYVMDCEDIRIDIKLKDALDRAIREAGLTPVSASSGEADANLVVIVLKEGYAVARSWPDQKYVAFGMKLWGSYEKADSVRATFLEEFDTSSVSSFRVVVGGMYGSSTWKEDQPQIGPQIVQNRNCEVKPKAESSSKVDELVTRVAIGEFLNLVHDDSIVVGVLCGFETDTCATKEIVDENEYVDQVVTFWACPGLRSGGEENLDTHQQLLFDCEKAMVKQLSEKMDPNDLLFNMFAVDSSAPFEMTQIFNSIWGNSKYRSWYIEKEHNLFFGISLNPNEEDYQRNFLDRYRKHVRFDPTTRAEFIIQESDKSIEIGVVSVGDEFIFHNLNVVERNIKAQLKDTVKIDIELRKIVGAQFKYKDNFEPREFSHDDYENEEARLQFSDQLSFGRETIFQLLLNAEKEGASMPSLEGLVSILETALSKLRFSSIESTTYIDVGDGAVAVTTFEQGSAVLAWDGRNHIDINLFNLNDREELAEAFVTSFLYYSQGNLVMALRDDYPRGTGRVINFRSDILPEEEFPKPTPATGYNY